MKRCDVFGFVGVFFICVGLAGLIFIKFALSFVIFGCILTRYATVLEEQENDREARWWH